MSQPVSNFKLLARAFDLAWARYYGPDHAGLLSPEIARPALAKFLVETAKRGTDEESALAASGVSHLVELTRERATGATLLHGSHNGGGVPEQAVAEASNLSGEADQS